MQGQTFGKVQTVLETQTQELVPKKQVGILGGNFNPVHYAHLVMGEQVGQALGLDKVYFMPEYLPPHVDEKKTIPAEHRLAMLDLAIADNPRFAVETIELERKGKSYTVDTMRELTAKNPDTNYYFIIGGDMVNYLPKWHQIDELMELVTFVGVRRPEVPIDSPYPIIWIDIPLMDVSSTTIRKKVQQGCSVRYLLPDNVLHYIQEKGLYLDEE
ncbi:nicotinate-nucleotide adenylyltransferase [Enterococcus sp.]|uniref:nicotinate-nucleotide adenylyltransferase n=1 Tax=Enterococcus sp. TaxID=35783 RepID=UPI000ECDA3B3|nr:nicotinate-nucleotide adenylyltransferase [Enterococcus sp.]HAB97319.1 nicotinate-nucleotide adenylyltransferase [Enterococcus sp.]